MIQSTNIMEIKKMKIVTMLRSIGLFVSFMFCAINVQAQKGFFVQVSVGPGFTTEYSGINGSGMALVTKNHTIGWGLTEKFALQIGEFGGLNKQKVGEFNYINLDAFGLGFTYRTPIDVKVSVLGAYSKVAFARKWSEPFGEDGGKGYGMNLRIDKEWFIAKRWGIRLGPHVYWIKTVDTNYQFFNVSLNGSAVFYLSPVK
jgi:hypothetical protein